MFRIRFWPWRAGEGGGGGGGGGGLSEGLRDRRRQDVEGEGSKGGRTGYNKPTAIMRAVET